MTLLRCRAITKSYGEHTVLQDAAFDLAICEKVGLVGHNGCGKTTLANIIFGSSEPDSGAVVYGGENLRIGYLLQDGSYKVHERGGGAVAEGGAGAEFDQRTHDKDHIFRKNASGLGLDRVWEWSDDRYAGLSGGERTKLALAGVWSSKPNLLILDEPTNHLDFAGIDWLVGEVARFGGAVIIISHDRYFLDQSVDRILELDDSKISAYSGNYTFYREEKLRRYESQLRQHLNDVKQQEKLAAEIANLRNWSEKAHRTSRDAAGQGGNKMGKKEYFRAKAKKMDRQVKSRIKRLESVQRDGVGKPKEEAGVFFEFESPDQRGVRLVAGTAVSKSFGERCLLNDCAFFVKRGECIGLVGPNGCGKTTLIRMTTGEQQPDQGEIWISPSARIGYLSQNGSEIDLARRVIDIVGDLPAALRTKARTVLANMGLGEGVIEKQLSQFSMGEVTRVRLAELIFKGYNLLILDEPTNHLDLASREQLEATLAEYGGAVLLVSHDRYMLEKLCDRYLVFAGTETEGGGGGGEGGFGSCGGCGGDLIRVDGSLQEWFAAKAAAVGQGQVQAEADEADAGPDSLMQSLLAIENRIAYLLGQLSRYKPTDSEYQAIDSELNELMAAKKRHIKQRNTDIT